MMEGRPRFWSILLLLASYLLLIPGLINPVFSFSIVINIIGHRKVVEPEAGHPVCTETTNGLAHLLWKTGSKIGAFLVILFSMVIPAIELVMLILGEVFRFGSAKCAEFFWWVIIWVQHRSKWASPDMFAYILLVDLVRTLEVESLILSRARPANKMWYIHVFLCSPQVFIIHIYNEKLLFWSKQRDELKVMKQLLRGGK